MTPNKTPAELEAEAKAQADVEAEAEANAKDAEKPDDKPEGEESEGEPEGGSDTKIDFEAKLKTERERAEKAEKAVADVSFKLREEKRKREEAGEEDDNKYLTAEQLESRLADERQKIQKDLTRQEAQRLAGNYTSDEAEKNLIIEIHKNRSFPEDMPLEEQIKESYAIANADRIIGENKELRRALRGKGGINNDPSSSHKDGLPASQPKLDPGEKSVLIQSGFTLNNQTRRWEKKINNGKNILIKDPKTGRIIPLK